MTDLLTEICYDVGLCCNSSVVRGVGTTQRFPAEPRAAGSERSERFALLTQNGGLGPCEKFREGIQERIRRRLAGHRAKARARRRLEGN